MATNDSRIDEEPGQVSGWSTLVKAIPGAAWLWRTARNQLSPHARALQRARALSPGQLLQDSAVTMPNRYPWLFSLLADRLGDVPTPNILSFGCSTGEEVFSLADYFPDARLTGIDINPRSIAMAEQRAKAHPDGARMRFLCAGSPQSEPDAHYDAILCLAVLRHGDVETYAPERCDPAIAFADVDRLVTDLSRCLKPGGYLAIWHSQFRFADMRVAPQFEPVVSKVNRRRTTPPLYGPDNQRIDGANYHEAVFRKL